MRQFAGWTIATLVVGFLAAGASGAPQLEPDPLDEVPESCIGGPVARSGSGPACHHIHIKFQAGVFVYVDGFGENYLRSKNNVVGANAPFPVTGVGSHGGEALTPEVRPGDHVLFHDHSGVSHTATNGVTTELEPNEAGTGIAGNNPDVPRVSTRFNDFDLGISPHGWDAYLVPDRFPADDPGKIVLPYYCSTFLHTALGMHGAIIVTE